MDYSAIVEDFYIGADGRRLFYRHITPEHPRGAVVLLHGYGEHGARYLETMVRLSDAGFAVYCPDHRGFGRNAQTPGDVESVALISKDISLLTNLAKETNPGVSMILIGHSMGGMLALNHLLDYQEDFGLAVASGPAVLPPPDTSAFIAAIAGIVARIAPRLPVQDLDLSAATRDPEMKARDEADPMQYRGKVLARTGYEVLRTQKRIQNSLSRISLPLLLLHGADDSIISPEASRLVYDGVSSAVKERIVFPGLYHEVFNEPERDTVFTRMFEWINERLGSRV